MLRPTATYTLYGSMAGWRITIAIWSSIYEGCCLHTSDSNSFPSRQLAEQRTSSPKRVTFEDHICDTPLIVDPASHMLHHRSRFGSSTRWPLGLHYSMHDRLFMTHRSLVDTTRWTRHWIHNRRQASNQQHTTRATSRLKVTHWSSTVLSSNHYEGITSHQQMSW